MADAELSVKITGDTSDLEGAINRVEQQLNNLSNAGGSGTQNGARNIENAYTRAGKKIKETGETIDAATKPLQKASVALAAGGVASAKFAIDFENSFADVTKTVDGTDAQLNKIKQDIIDMSTKGINGHSAIPQTTTELNELAAAGGQLGIQTENISKFTETMAMIGSATNLSGEAGAKTLARFMNVTGTSQDQVQNLGSAVVDLGNNFATTEAEIMDMAMNMGATGSAVNISAQDILAYSTVLSSLGAEAASGGSAISRIWMDIQSAVSEGGSELSTFAQMSGKSAEQFAADWKSSASGAFKDLIQGLSESEDIVGDLQKMGFNNIRDIQALQKLAGPQGMQLLNEALERSNNAWSENTALMNEFNNKAGTTASQLAVTKNNIIEAGRSIGEMLLPSINNGAIKVKNFAQGIADMSDGQKQALITTGKFVIGLGATAKGAASVTKSVGSVVEAYGKIKGAMGEGGALVKFVPALKGIASTAPYAAAGIVAVTGAVAIGKAAYDGWYKSQYKWSEGLAETDNKLQTSLDSYKKISDVQKQLKEAKLVIENPESSKEEVEAAKSKIEEIKALLETEYNLKIKSDNSNLDEAVGKVKKLTGNDLRQAIAEEEGQLAQMYDAYQKSLSELPKLQAEYDNANERLTRYKEIKSELDTLGVEYRNAQISQDEWKASIKEAGLELGLTADQADNAAYVFQTLAEKMNGAQTTVDGLKGRVEDLNKSQQDYENISKSFTNKMTELFSEQLVSGDSEGASKTLERIGKAAARAKLDLEGYGEILTNIARASGEIGENQSIHISADGAISVLDEIEGKIQKIQTKGGATVQVTAEGDVSILDEAGNEVQYLAGIGAVSLSVNANGNIDVLDQAGEKIAEIPQNVDTNTTVTITKDSSEVDDYQPEDKDGKAVYTKDTSDVDGWKPPTKRGTVIYQARMEGMLPLPNAKGTQNFEGGLAMINDQRGVTDPRELVEVNGKGYIFEGRDVVLPLPKHSKVYTASQTRHIMSVNNIPHYANGKNNEEWDNAKSDWTHYTKINEVSAYEALEHWDEMMAKFKGDADVIKEIQEEIVASTKDMWNEDIDTMQFFLDMGVDSEEHYYKWLETYRDEYFEGNTEQWRKATLEIHKYQQEQAQATADMLNKESEEYIKLHTIAGDWTDIGDSAIAAFGRVKDRAELDIAAGLKSKKEADEYLKELGADIYQNYIDDADKWISRERNYNAMSTDAYIASLERKKDKTKEIFANQLIDYETYVSAMQSIDDEMLDAYATKVSDWRDDADWYQQQSEVYGWGFNGTGHDTAESFWRARLDKELGFANDENLSANERKSALRYADKARLEIYKAREDALDDELKKFKESIEKTRTALDKEVQTLRKSWETEDRDKDIDETKKMLALYKNSQTKEGQDKYKQLQDDLEKLEREKLLADMEAENNEILENLQDEYDEMEKAKLSELKKLAGELASNGGISTVIKGSLKTAEEVNLSVGNIVQSLNTFGGTFTTFAERICGLIENLQPSQTVNNYSTEQNIVNNIKDSVDALSAYLNASNLAMSLYGRRS